MAVNGGRVFDNEVSSKSVEMLRKITSLGLIGKH